ncbi:hypothetical protein H1Q63_28945 [Desmonostoc muscorum CCALA 125]|nr:hypothetical protein [Desmonostoc muscorum CCALA 125]
MSSNEYYLDYCIKYYYIRKILLAIALQVGSSHKIALLPQKNAIVESVVSGSVALKYYRYK